MVENSNFITNGYEYGVHGILLFVFQRVFQVEELKKSGDPRVVGPNKEIFDTYIRYTPPVREFPKPEEVE